MANSFDRIGFLLERVVTLWAVPSKLVKKVASLVTVATATAGGNAAHDFDGYCPADDRASSSMSAD